jgi:hypothetical protein
MMVVFAALWWDKPLVQFNASRLWPFAHIFAIPGFPGGAVSAVSWHIVTSRTCKRVFDLVGFTPKPKKTGLLGLGIMGL